MSIIVEVKVDVERAIKLLNIPRLRAIHLCE